MKFAPEINGIKLQRGGTWLFSAVLVDLGDALAEELSLPFDSISIEMIYRGLDHFIVAYNQGTASDPVKYFSAPENFFFTNPLTSCFSA